MIEQFNRILRAHGSNRMELLEVNDGYIKFRIVGWASFLLRQDGRLQEQVEQARYGGFAETDRSKWLHAISLGKKRDEEGSVG